MKMDYERIWLTDEDPDGDWETEFGEVSWCDESLNDADVEYVNVRLFNAQAAEIAADDRLLAERNRVLDAIPECPEHGPQCVPHALEWIEKTQAYIAELEFVIKCACQFLDENQKEAGIGEGTAFMLRAALGRETKHGDDNPA